MIGKAATRWWAKIYFIKRIYHEGDTLTTTSLGCLLSTVNIWTDDWQGYRRKLHTLKEMSTLNKLAVTTRFLASDDSHNSLQVCVSI